jgi:hypothetical protein
MSEILQMAQPTDVSVMMDLRVDGGCHLQIMTLIYHNHNTIKFTNLK